MNDVAIPGAAFSDTTVEVEGRAIRYREAGQGDVLVSLHGAGGLRMSFAHDILAESHRVIVFEMPGFGASAPFEGSLQDLAETMRKAMKALGIDTYNLMANSFGTKVATWMAIQDKDALAALVLVAPAVIRNDRPPLSPEERAAAMYAHPERQPPAEPVPPGVAEQQDALLRRLIGPARDPELESHLPDLDIPVMAVFGTEDKLTPPDAAHLFRELFPNCSLMMVYDAAHQIDADRPEATAAVIDDFLARHEAFLVTNESGVIHP